MAPKLPQQFTPARIRSYIFRLPVFTRLVILLVVVAWVVSIQSVWNLLQWGALIPQEIGMSSMYRTNTFPFIHAGLIHAALNVVALTPLLERFEAEHGTLNTVALFIGPLSTIPALTYTLLELVILHGNTALSGASTWIFTLLGIEAIKTYRANPYFVLGSLRIPTWTSPLIIAVFVTFLISNTNFLGHLCGLAVGYLFGLGYLKFLAPPEKVLRWVESRLNLLGRVPHYVSVDQKTYGRYGVLPTSTPTLAVGTESSSSMAFVGGSQRLGP